MPPHDTPFLNPLNCIQGTYMRDILVYYRIRYIRNLPGHLYPCKASVSELLEVKKKLIDTLDELYPESRLYDFEHCDADHIAALTERGYCGPSDPFAVSRALLLLDTNHAFSVNDRDHMRISYMAAGKTLADLFKTIVQSDIRLDERLNWACLPERGFLSSRIDEAGSAMGFSALVFIPGIIESNMYERVFHSLLSAGIVPRLKHEQHSGDNNRISPFVELFYSVPVGTDEQTAVQQFEEAMDKLCEGERKTREKLVTTEKVTIEDRFFRSDAILRSARLLDAEELVTLLGALRCGLVYEVKKSPDMLDFCDYILMNHGTAQVKIAFLEKSDKNTVLNENSFRAELVRRAFERYHI